jgi:tRNA(fMet)-specific endonuclease VapC
MYLLDSNICIALMKNDRTVIPRFNRYFPQCHTSSIVVAELYKGVFCSKRIEENLRTLTEFIALLDILPFDSFAAEEFGKIQAELRKLSRPTGDFDALIAAVARSRGDILVTNNTRDFQNIPELQLEDWLKP